MSPDGRVTLPTDAYHSSHTGITQSGADTPTHPTDLPAMSAQDSQSTQLVSDQGLASRNLPLNTNTANTLSCSSCPPILLTWELQNLVNLSLNQHQIPSQMTLVWDWAKCERQKGNQMPNGLRQYVSIIINNTILFKLTPSPRRKWGLSRSNPTKIRLNKMSAFQLQEKWCVHIIQSAYTILILQCNISFPTWT